MNLKAAFTVGIACAISVGLCLLYAKFRPELPGWWRNHGGGIPYVLFWVLFCLTIRPRRSALIPVCIACVAMTCVIELSQLWDGPPWLSSFRRTKFGAALIGYGFDPNDIPPYFIGGFLGYSIGLAILPKRYESEAAK